MVNDERLLKVLEQVVNLYIKTGEPVGSVSVCNSLKKNVSSATVRSDMVKLEKLGLLNQPHVSAGRIPTYDGFRIYIKRVMKPEPVSLKEQEEIDSMLRKDMSSVSAVINNALVALSDLTNLTTVSTAMNSSFSVISKVEVISTGRRVYVILIVTSTGEVKNKICRVEFDFTESQLNMLKKILNESLIGSKVDLLSTDVMLNLSAAIGGYFLSFSPLFKALREISDEMSRNRVVLKGENRLMAYEGVEATEILNFLSAKDNIEKILSGAFSGINIVFGKESDFFQIGNSSLIITKYRNKLRELGSFGVIGPVRLDYKKVMSYVEYFERSVSEIINNMELEDELED